jgi:radical SAM-linked protein
MSFGPPLPLGFRSRAEVFDLELTRPPGFDLAERLNAVLPEGLHVTDFRPILYKNPSLMCQLEGASYRVRFPASYLAEAGIAPGELHSKLCERVTRLLSQDVVVVRRKSEDKAREFDARPSIAAMHAGLDEAPAVLDLHLRFTLRASARPDDLLGLLVPEADPRTVDVERTALWADRGGERWEPLRLLSSR